MRKAKMNRNNLKCWYQNHIHRSIKSSVEEKQEKEIDFLTFGSWKGCGEKEKGLRFVERERKAETI